LIAVASSLARSLAAETDCLSASLISAPAGRSAAMDSCLPGRIFYGGAARRRRRRPDSVDCFSAFSIRFRCYLANLEQVRATHGPNQHGPGMF